ncbi:hypothetical protein [Saccharothrix violaceirubra]|uniref:Uncharacterized protein n=1 Tax=Saccharothrix violaceirubra TaxID=413306 RepID=A0A7W7WTS4_9PSEU|nr:hypothetical protein [Saccharothrix violaceirubra]MBB4963032.1 hypothetical protein [Saccharothrix violaceirubra]
MFFKWPFGRGNKITTCACVPEWPGLVAEQAGHHVTGVPSPEGSSPMVMMLGLVAHCTGCGARYPHGWRVAD